jgi:hypothetical protein
MNKSKTAPFLLPYDMLKCPTVGLKIALVHRQEQWRSSMSLDTMNKHFNQTTTTATKTVTTNRFTSQMLSLTAGMF